MRFGGACHRRLCSACSQQQYGVPQAPASDSVRTCWYHSPSRRPRTTAVAYKTFSCHGVSAAHDDSVVVVRGRDRSVTAGDVCERCYPIRRGAIMHRRYALAVVLVGLFAASDALAQRKPVQVGYCTPLRNLEAAKAAGFDYVELSTTEIANLSDADFEQALTRIQQVGLPVPATNLFLPAALKVTGPAIDRDQQTAYVKKAFARLQRIGTQIVVF